MLNKADLIGRLTKDIELRYLGNGTPVANFTLAVNRAFKNKAGEKEADFINIIVWRKQAENCANYISKGSLVAISGRMQSRSYDTDNGKRYITEVVANEVHFLDSKNKNSNFDSKVNSDEEDLPEGLYPVDEDEDELPF